MREIADEADFAWLLTARQAILFVDFDWSAQSKLSASVVVEWERTSHLWGLNEPVYRVRPDRVPAAADWIKCREIRLKGEGGYGSLIWLRFGQIVDYEPYVVGAGLRDISQRTRTVFLQEA
ncbi:MAG: hypothetical protein U0835_03350 [Isosphaeraceae bacterium]